MTNIADIVKSVRETLSLTQKELAGTLCVSESTVQKWEAGRNSPTICMLEDILDLIGQTISITVAPYSKISTEVGRENGGKSMKDSIKGTITHTRIPSKDGGDGHRIYFADTGIETVSCLSKVDKELQAGDEVCIMENRASYPTVIGYIIGSNS